MHGSLSTADLVSQGLSGLSQLSPQLHARATQFVNDGSDPMILMDLAGAGPGAGDLLGEPGRLIYYFRGWQLDDAVKQAGEASLAGRHLLYRQADSSDEWAALLARLGKVLGAVDARRTLYETGASMPDWLQYLLNDALHATLDDMADGERTTQRPGWQIHLLCAILRAEGLPVQMALPIIFERARLYRSGEDRVYQAMLAPGALDDFMAAHPEMVDQTIKALSPNGQTILARRVGASPALRNALAAQLVALAVSDNFQVRHTASAYLSELDVAPCTALLAAQLRGGGRQAREYAAILLARLRVPEAAALIEEALAAESNKPAQAALHSALLRLHGASGAVHADMPELPPEPPELPAVLGPEAVALLHEMRAQLVEELHAELEAAGADANRYKSYYDHLRTDLDTLKALTVAEIEAAVRALNGVGSPADRERLDHGGIRQVIERQGSRIAALPGFGLRQLLRYVQLDSDRMLWYSSLFAQWLAHQDPESLELRQMGRIIVEEGGDPFEVPDACLYSARVSAPQYVLPAHRVWPYFAANPDAIDSGLGLAPPRCRHSYAYDLGCTLDIIGLFPQVPARWIPRIMDIALGDNKTHRAQAQELLSTLPDIGRRVTDTLVNGKLEQRLQAARWLQQLGYRDAVPDLYGALAKETRETASAALITTLEKLGEDMSAYLTPEKLLAQARKSLKAKAPAGLAWLNFDMLPACRWQDGSPVDPDIPRSWVTLACKLKEPGGNPLLERYLGLLSEPSRAALGSFVLEAFIAQDTRCPPLEEAQAYAQQRAPAEYQDYLRMVRDYPEYDTTGGALTEAHFVERLKNAYLKNYLGSAINEKGILALISGLPGHQLVGRVQQYMRDHYVRRAQIEAMLEAASALDAPAVIQFLLGVARRYRTASVQEKARLLVERIAERNGWTPEQLADRTVPTGGLEADGRVTLEYGSRQFEVTLDDAMKVVLRNSEGKVVAALPEPRRDDDPTAIKEAKSQLATCKREVKQVLDQQGLRLYEAMCAGRAWPAGEWREYIHQHPLVGRLAQRLVWAVCRADGALLRAFRPVEDGTLIDVLDDEVSLEEKNAEEDQYVRLAHGTLLPPGDAPAWLRHFKDYKIKPLFGQFTRGVPALPAAPAMAIDERLGWVTDAFTLRTACTKLGYQRGRAEEGGVFTDYAKDFVSAGIGARIEFSGNALPEENMAVALKELRFYRIGARGRLEALALADVPPVLLAETYGDYQTVAAACTGFDADWKSKVRYQ